MTYRSRPRPDGDPAARQPGPPGHGNSRETEDAARKRQHRRHVAEQEPPHDDREWRYEVAHRTHPPSTGASQGVRPEAEPDCGGEEAQVDRPRDGPDIRSPQVVDQLWSERQAHDPAD